MALLAAVLLAACGGSSHHRTVPQPPPSAAKTVKVCSGLTDKCVSAPAPQLNRLAQVHPFHGCRIVDVSDYQSASINWRFVGHYTCGAIDKMGEGGNWAAGGRHFARNWAAQRAAGLWHAPYWFVRPMSCTVEGDAIVNRLIHFGYTKDYNAGRVELDEEVPGAAALTTCLNRIIYHAFHRDAGVYTAPGTWSGGSHDGLPLWQAEYGPTLHPFWQPVVAWQCTDGIVGCVSNVPGIGFTDVSRDMGITNEHLQAPPPKCLANRWPHTSQCKRVRYGYSKLEADRAKVQHQLFAHQCYKRRHPSYCGGWRHARSVDDAKLAALRKTYA
jgi:hypothetical protein